MRLEVIDGDDESDGETAQSSSPAAPSELDEVATVVADFRKALPSADIYVYDNN